MSTEQTPDCRRCTNAHNGVNGRYCKPLRRYVEHSPRPLCLPAGAEITNHPKP